MFSIVASLMLAGAYVFASNNNNTADCCYEGAACCVEGAACCEK